MTDKVQKIREEVERLRNLHQMKYQQLDTDNSMSLVECGKRNLCNELLSFIDSLQKEPVKIKKGCKYLCLGDMFNNDTGKIGFIGGKIYLAPEDNTLVSEENGWRCDTSENASNFELVEEPVSIWHDASEKPERDDLLIETNDGRIIHRQSVNNYGMVKRWAYTSALLNLDNSCNLGNNSQEEPVSVWHNASEEPNDTSHCLIFYGCKESVGHYLHYEPVLYNKKEKMFVTSSLPHPTGYKRDRISISDITQWCYLCDLHNLSNVERTVNDWKEEPVSEYLEEAAFDYAEACKYEGGEKLLCVEHFKAGAQWQKDKMVANAINTEASLTMSVPSICISLPLGVNVGDKVKVIVIKED